MKHPRKLLALGTALSFALLPLLAGPAAATDATQPPVLGELDTASFSDTEDKFSSLTSALMSMNASQAGQNLETYLANNDLIVTAGSGTKNVLLKGKSGKDGKKLKAATVQDLDSQLAGSGMTLDVRSYSNLQDLASDVVAKSHTADAAVTLAGAKWAGELGKLHMPKLSAPNVGNPGMPDIPVEALPFGLLMDKAIAGTVLNAPDLFAQATKTGVGSDALAKTFSKQMQEAWSASNRELTDVLPNKCVGAMMAVMASGDEKSAEAYGNCSPSCVTGGKYLNAQSGLLFAPASGKLSADMSNTLWNYETFLHMPEWTTSDLLEQNPQYAEGLLSEDGSAGGARMCNSASTSTSAVLSDSLPGVFSLLRPGK